jgi:hypothetical protein
MITQTKSLPHSMEQNLSEELNGSLVKRLPLLCNLLTCSYEPASELYPHQDTPFLILSSHLRVSPHASSLWGSPTKVLYPFLILSRVREIVHDL